MWINFGIILIYMLAMAAFGFFFSRKQKTTTDYYVAQGKIPSWAMGISLMATLISSMTFIAYPAASYKGGWELLTPGLMVPVALLLVVFVLVPFYRKHIGVSAYEYFGKRFGSATRVYSSFAFSLNHFAKMGFIFYLLAMAMAGMTGWNVYAIIIGLGVVTVFYTMVGGIEAVIWTDVIQGIILIVGMLVSLGFIFLWGGVDGGEIWQRASDAGKFSLGDPDISFTGQTIIVLLMYGFAWNFQKYAADQTIVQRYLSVKTDKGAIRGTVLGALLCIPIWAIFMLIGTGLWGFYEVSGEILPDHIKKAEEIFPYFLTTHMPVGLNGLVIAAMMAAAMSTLSSDLNCLSAIVVKDYYVMARPNASDKSQLKFARWSVFGFGIMCVIIAIGLVKSQGTALSMWYTVSSVVSAGLAGLFFLAFMSTRANRNGTFIGIATCIAFTAWATATMGKGQSFDLGFLKEPLNGYMVGVIGHVVLVVVGYFASYLFPQQENIRELTLWGWLDHKRELSLNK